MKTRTNPARAFLTICVLSYVLSACSLLDRNEKLVAGKLTITVTPIFPQLSRTSSNLPTPTPINSSESMQGSARTSGSCKDAATFISDVTVPDNSVMAANERFLKTWRIRNSGSCVWNTGYSMAFVSGKSLEAPAEIHLTRIVLPESSIDLSVDLVAPAVPGNYQGNWQLRNDRGEIFGVDGDHLFWVKIKVINDTATPATRSPAIQAG